MQGKQNSLVPVAKVIADLPGLGLAIGPSQHSFTIADQVNQLVRASDADPRSRLHGPHNSTVQPTPHQPRQPAPVQARQRSPSRSS